MKKEGLSNGTAIVKTDDDENSLDEDMNKAGSSLSSLNSNTQDDMARKASLDDDEERFSTIGNVSFPVSGSTGPQGTDLAQLQKLDAQAVAVGTALWDYEAIEDNELSFKTGETIYVGNLCNTDWYWGWTRENEQGQRAEGFFPANRIFIPDIIPPVPSVIPQVPIVSPLFPKEDKEDSAEKQLDKALPRPPLPERGVSQSQKETWNVEEKTLDSNEKTTDKKAVKASRRMVTVIQNIQLDDIETDALEVAKTKDQANTSEIELETLTESPFVADNLGEGNAIPLDQIKDSIEEIADENQIQESLRSIEDLPTIPGTVLNAHRATDDTENVDAFDHRKKADLSPSKSVEWMEVKNEQGESYYWNTKTDATTWTAPSKFLNRETIPLKDENDSPEAEELRRKRMQDMSQESLMSAQSHELLAVKVSEAGETVALSSIPAHIIKKQGLLGVKPLSDKKESQKDVAKKEAWRTVHVVACPGVLAFYDTKKPTSPCYTLSLASSSVHVVTSKAVTKKKNVFSVETSSTSSPSLSIANSSSPSNSPQQKQPFSDIHWLFLCNSDAEMKSWMDAIVECRWDGKEADPVIPKLLSLKIDSISAISPEKKAFKLPEAKALKMKLTSLVTETPAETHDDKKKKTKLGNIFGKKKDRVGGPPVFGGTLAELAAEEKKTIPTIVEKCIREVDRRGLLSQGIYRLSGNTSTIQKLKAQFDNYEEVKLHDEALDINAVSGLLKLYFRELKNPLLPFELYDKFVSAIEIQDYDKRLLYLKGLIQALPKVNYDVLEYLMRHLQRVVSESEVNKMETSNLAIVFGPTIVRPPNSNEQTAYDNIMAMAQLNQIVEHIIVQTEWLFDGAKEN